MEKQSIDALIAPITFFKNRLWVHSAYIITVLTVLLLSAIGNVLTSNDIWMIFFEMLELFLFSYILTGLLIPRLLYKNKYWVFGIISIITIAIFGIGSIERTKYMYSDIPDIDKIFWTSYLSTFFLYFFMVLGLKVGKDLIIKQYETEQYLRKNTEQELSFLKSQISPHFLLNTLNNLYGLSVAKSDKLPPLIVQLSDLLRFTVYNTKSELVPINDELRYLHDYISLQKIRLNHASKLIVDIPHISPHKGFIMPMVFIVFIENAFKHGLSITDSEDFCVKFVMKIDEKFVSFECENYFENIPFAENTKLDDDGIGIENTLRRLTLIYGKEALPIILITKNRYQLNIKIPLHGSTKMPDR